MAILPEGKPSPPEMGGYEPAQTSAALAPFHDAAGAIHRCATSGCKGVTAIARGKGLWETQFWLPVDGYFGTKIVAMVIFTS